MCRTMGRRSGALSESGEARPSPSLSVQESLRSRFAALLLTFCQGLTLAARSEAQISVYSSQRPSTAASTASTGLSKIIPSLLTAIDEDGDIKEHVFQATVCLGWLHYVLEEPGLAVARLPKEFAHDISDLSSQSGSLSGWTRVCIIKGAFLKGAPCHPICHLPFCTLTV
jgi:hypothetical protein